MRSMTFEQIENRWRRFTGATDPDDNGLMLLPFQEQVEVCIRAFTEELEESPGFSPMIWTATLLGFCASVWEAALSVEVKRDTRDRHSEEAVMVFMGNADPDVEYVWRGVTRILEDLEVPVKTIENGLDRLEKVSLEFLKKHEQMNRSGKTDLEDIDLEHQADQTRLFVRFGLPELRRRLKALEQDSQG